MRARTARPPPACSHLPAVHADLLDALVEQAQAITVGGTEVEGVDYGPLNSAVQLDRVEGFVRRVPAHARVVTGGQRVGEQGFCFAPTVVAGLRQDDEMVQNEIFGPVITVQRFTDEAEALDRPTGSNTDWRRACGPTTTVGP